MGLLSLHPGVTSKKYLDIYFFKIGNLYMTGTYAASFLPAMLVPMMAVLNFVVLGLLFKYIESEA